MHAGKILLKIIARCLSEYCKRMGVLPEEQSNFRPNRSTTDIMFAIRQLQALAWKEHIPLYVCFTNLTYNSVDRIFLWTVLARFGAPQNMISIIRLFHDDVRLDDRVCSGWFAIQGPRKGYVLLLFKLFFAAVMNVAYTRFKADKDIVDALVHLSKTQRRVGEGGGVGWNCRRASPGGAPLRHALS